MQRLFGDVLRQKARPKASVPASVSWKWYDQSQGLVEWDFDGGSDGGMFLLQRGASMGSIQFEDYIFGQAFWVMYVYNSSQFGTSLLQAPPSPLVDNGVENNSPPMAVVDSPSGKFVAFVFTLAPGQKWSMLEGGFQDGITPSNPVLIPVTIENPNPQQFCVQWNPEQCQGFNSQVGTSLPCPPNPWNISSIVMKTSQQVPILIPDTFQSGPCQTAGSGCPDLLKEAEQALDSGDFIDALKYFLSYIISCGIEEEVKKDEGDLKRLVEKLRSYA